MSIQSPTRRSRRSTAAVPQSGTEEAGDGATRPQHRENEPFRRGVPPSDAEASGRKAGPGGRVAAPHSWISLVRENLPLVKYVLGKLSGRLPTCVDRDDLFAAGSLGLIEAARRFDPERNVAFHNYAIPRIHGAMLDELRSHDWLSVSVRDQVKKLQRSRTRLLREGAPRPTVEELAADLGYSVKRVTRLMAIADAKQRYVTPAAETYEATERDADTRSGAAPSRTPSEEAEFSDQKHHLAKAIEKLPDREKRVVILRYHEGLFLREIGRLLGVSESRICQIHGRALRRLRGALKRVERSPTHAG